MTTIKKIYVILLLFGAVNSLKAQQPFTYTQYMENLTPVNPAYSLLNPQGAVDLVVRKQWLGIKGAPSTLIADAYLPVGNDEKTMAGLVVMHDNIAVENQTEADAFLAKAIQISSVDYLAVSLNAGVRRYVTDFAGLDPEDPALADDIHETVFNAGFGIMAYGKDDNGEIKYYAGLSAPRISVRTLGGGTGREKRYLKDQFYITAGIYKYLADEIKIRPAVLVSHTTNVPLQADFSVVVYLQDKIGFGLNYRSSNEAAGLVSVNIGSNLRLNYSYQMGLGSSRIGNFGNDTHEAGISYKLGSYY